ncbi:MAG: PoNe immunity protein domain-containing protein [Maritimibacter sp.]
MRDTRKDESYWQGVFEDLDWTINFARNLLREPDRPLDKMIMPTADLEADHLKLTNALYSSGAPIPDCVAQARSLLMEAYPGFVDACRRASKQAMSGWHGGTDMRTRYLALAVLCRLTPDEARPLVEALDFWPERDAVWERFIALLGLGEGRPPVNTLVWADAYAPLLEALDPEISDFERKAALHTFDKGWLKEMRKSTSPRYSNHNNKHNTYVGYWNFEAAGAAAAMGIDDSLLEGSKTYPKDWADWAKG